MARAVRTASQLDTGLLLACGILAAVAVIMPSWMQDAVATTVRRTLMAPLVNIQQKAEVVRSTIVSRDSVQMLGAVSAGLALSAPALANENAQLRRLIGLGSRLKRGFVAAEVLEIGTLEQEFTLTVSAGSNAGVERGTPIVTSEGLVGMVQSVDPTISIAISWAHPDFGVSAMSVDGAAFGIVKPHLGTGAQRWLLELRGVPFRAELKEGAEIVSSGLGRGYPRGIPIGTVLGEVQTTEKWVRTYILKPAVLPNSPGPVLLMIPSRSPKDVSGVWTTIASADSAERSIVQVGDSMAKKAALDEIAARRATLDSTGRDSLRLDSLGVTSGVGTAADSARRAAARDTTKRPARGDTSTRPKPPTGPPPPGDAWR